MKTLNRREMTEELKLVFDRLDHIGTLHDIVSGSPHSVHIFRTVTDELAQPDQREVVEARLFDPADLPPNLSHRTADCLAMWRDNRDGL